VGGRGKVEATLGVTAERGWEDGEGDRGWEAEKGLELSWSLEAEREWEAEEGLRLSWGVRPRKGSG